VDGASAAITEWHLCQSKLDEDIAYSLAHPDYSVWQNEVSRESRRGTCGHARLHPAAASAGLSHGSVGHRWMLGKPAVCARRHLCRDPLPSHGQLRRAGSHGNARPCARAGPTAHQARIDRSIPAHKSEIRSGAQLWQGSAGPARGRGTSRLTAGCQSCRTPFTRAEQSARQGSRTRPPGAPSAESPARRHPGAGRRSPRHLPSAVR